MRKLALFSAFAAFAALPVAAQINVISAKAGLIHYTEGDVTLDGTAVDTSKPAKLSEMKNGSELRTGEGRVEVLLAAPSFVRLSENSALKMVNNSLGETRVEILAGSALLEVSEVEKGSSVTVMAGGSTVAITKNGIYRVDMEPTPSLRVYDGEANVANNGKLVAVKEGKSVGLSTGGEFLLAKFDNKAGDELYRWSKRRSGYVSMANVAAANMVHTYGYTMMPGSWIWNPYFGMYTAVPMRGFFRSPFGYRYYNPQMAYGYITQPVYSAPARSYDSGYGGYSGTGSMNPTYNSGFGYNTTPTRSSGGYSGGYSGGATAGSAPAAPVAGGGDGGSRGGGATSVGGGTRGGGGGN